ncbi:MAG: hypothetical protein IIX96_03970 [Clostridia bacterium]|jgi:hypothetical protein|nr:hypothetical protein [Clostridia bacterium]
MAKKKTLTKTYNELPLIARVIIQLVFGVVVGGIYRIVRYFESGKLSTLVAGLLVTFTGVGNVISWVIDLACLILYKKYTLFVD